MPRRRLLALVAATCAVAAGAPSAQAATVRTLTTSQSPFDPGVRNQGWWSPTIANDDSNDNYIVQPTWFRNFFTFETSAACRAVRATLQLTRFDQFGALTYSLWDVSTPAPALNANDGTSRAIYDDLGSGTTFGSFPVAPGPAGDVLGLPLNAAGVAALNAALGGRFSVGGSAAGADDRYLYGFSGDGRGVQQLAITCAPADTDECRGGGWRDFGVFRNQGDCVSYVATGGGNGAAGRGAPA